MIPGPVSLLAAAAAIVILTRCICVLYHTHWSRHPRHAAHWLAFGLSYVVLAGAAALGALALIGGDDRPLPAVVMAFLVASAGLIAFDRRRETCNRAPSCAKRVRP